MKAPDSNPSSLRSIPSVDRLVRELGPTDLPRRLLVEIARGELAGMREETGENDLSRGDEARRRMLAAVAALRLSRIQPVINATGILVHTNFGRSPLGPAVVESLVQAAGHYTNLEYDLARGERGARGIYVEQCLALLCEAETATVVNNCAAALVLMLRHFATSQKPEVVVSRGELVQIGGGFRVPDILESSGAKLREIGTTNKTTLDDYARAIGPETAMLLKVHRSNFYMDGFVAAPSTQEIAELARRKNVPFAFDLGSGALMPTETFMPAGSGIIPEHEPTPAEAIQHGADIVCFSGDKLLGGPQAGIIAGSAKHIAALKKEPLFRALRCDKLILAAMQATAELHLAGSAQATGNGIPIFHLLRISNEALHSRAEAIARSLEDLPLTVSIEPSEARIGGGSLPRTVIPSMSLALLPDMSSLQDFADRLRRGQPAVIGCVTDGRFRLDLRTVFPHQDALLFPAIRAACQEFSHHQQP